MKSKGFTLIELLVVISIISLLSTVVMTSLNQSRAKAQEATIKQSLQSIKTQAELEYSKTGDYSNVAPAIAPILAHINKNGGTATSIFSNISPINEGYKRYAVSVKLNSDPTKNWSVSSEGNAAVWDTNDTDSNGNPVPSEQSVPVNWTQAENNCKNNGKRLPTVEELKALYDSGVGAPINNFKYKYYWSSTSNAIISTRAWIVSMGSGGLNHYFKATGAYSARCVL